MIRSDAVGGPSREGWRRRARPERGPVRRGLPLHVLAAGLALACLLPWAAPAAAAQEPDPAGLPPAPAATAPGDTLLERLRSRYGRVAASPHAHGTLVGVAIRIPAGADRDPPGREGTAHLLAQIRERQAGNVLDPARATLTARVERGATVYTLLAVPEGWAAALARVDSLLFRAPVPPALVEGERARLAETLHFEAGSPIRIFEDEAASLLVEAGSPWATPVRGTLGSVEALSAGALAEWHREHVVPGEASVALAGPLPAAPAEPRGVDALPLDSAGAGKVGTADPEGGAGGPAERASTDAPPAPPGMAWRVGDRVALVQEVTSGWIAVAWPAPDTVPRTALELLAHLMEEELDPVPPDPDRYDVEVEVLEAPGGPVLRVRATLLPEALPRWEARILETVESLTEDAMEPDFFRWRRRRFRTERLLAEAAPEAEAIRMTRDLAARGRARDLDRAVWSLDPATLLATARSLGEARILVLGPDLGHEGSH